LSGVLYAAEWNENICEKVYYFMFGNTYERERKRETKTIKKQNKREIAQRNTPAPRKNHSRSIYQLLLFLLK
jgi:hypothetical protein